MLTANSRMDKLAAARIDFKLCGMLEGTCLLDFFNAYVCAFVISLTNLEIGDEENDILNHKMSFELTSIAGDADLHLQPVPIVDDYDEMDPDKPTCF